MARFLHCVFPHSRRKYGCIFLALAWMAGLMLGAQAFRRMGGVLSSRLFLAGTAALPGMTALLCGLMPFLLSVMVVFSHRPGLLCGIGFCKAFLFSYVSCGVLAAYPVGGWLVRWLLLFTDSCTCCVLYGYWHRNLTRQPVAPRGNWFCGAGCGCIALIDAALIAPLLRQVLS